MNFIKNIELNECNNIKPFCLGLGNVNSRVSMNINDSLNKGKHSVKVNFNDSKTKINIPITQLDNFPQKISSNQLK